MINNGRHFKKNIESRELIIQSLKEEMIGPLDFSKNMIDIIDEHTLEKDIKGKILHIKIMVD